MRCDRTVAPAGLRGIRAGLNAGTCVMDCLGLTGGCVGTEKGCAQCAHPGRRTRPYRCRTGSYPACFREFPVFAGVGSRFKSHLGHGISAGQRAFGPLTVHKSAFCRPPSGAFGGPLPRSLVGGVVGGLASSWWGRGRTAWLPPELVALGSLPGRGWHTAMLAGDLMAALGPVETRRFGMFRRRSVSLRWVEGPECNLGYREQSKSSRGGRRCRSAGRTFGLRAARSRHW
ncbi:hypothetical protein J2S92_004047 [Arthrobacter bambusae]|nr:hypothetical protein [Arthrobacter bambusae]MDQ0237643.1 hypothetical protein [Arthrobacter bambusae]